MEETAASVLIVDDDAVTRAVVRTGLKQIGAYRVLEATDGAAAQEVLRTDDVDVVITDLLMPGLSGLDLIRWAKENGITPVWIILSGVDTFDAAVEAIQVGAFDFLAKPPGMPELEVSVRNALERRRLVEERDRLFAQLEAEWAVTRRDLQRAEVIQRALLPAQPPALDRYSINALYRPGDHVGGDLYNVIRVGPRHLVLYVADATGHGVSSAMLSVLFYRRLVISDHTGTPLPPGDVLARVNQAMCAERVGAGLFLTAAYAVLDLDTGELRLAAAGHPPVVLRTAAGVTRKIARTGPVLGLTGQAHYDEVVTRIGANDRLLFFTDGLLQQDEQKQWLAIDDALASAGVDGKNVVHALLNGMNEDDGQRDDVTLLLLEASDRPSHFNNMGAAAPTSPRAAGATGSPAIWYGETANTSVLQVRGRGTWLNADAFYDTARAIAEDLRPVVIDLSACPYLDSTFLGTIHELVTTCGAGIQGVTATVRALFEELDMQQVLAAADRPAQPLPADMQPLSTVAAADAASQKRMLRAHETLASLSVENREKFRAVVETMRAQAPD